MTDDDYTIHEVEIPGQGPYTIRMSKDKQRWWSGIGHKWAEREKHFGMLKVGIPCRDEQWETVRQYILNVLLPKINLAVDPPEAPQKFYRFKHLELD